MKNTLKKIINRFRKEKETTLNSKQLEPWETVDVSSLIENKTLLMDENASYELFCRVCIRAKAQNIEFDKILIPIGGYTKLHNELSQQIPNAIMYNMLLKPFTSKGHQTLEGIKSPVTGTIIQVFTTKESQIIN